jgi:hypothetical protein
MLSLKETTQLRVRTAWHLLLVCGYGYVIADFAFWVRPISGVRCFLIFLMVFGIGNTTFAIRRDFIGLSETRRQSL